MVLLFPFRVVAVTPCLLLMSFIILQFAGVDAFSLSATSIPTTSSATTRLALFRGASSSRASSPLAEEALACYPFLFRPEKEEKTAKGRPKLSTTKSQALKTFNEMARLYGDERALNMVKIQPVVLSFDSKNFEPSLNAWAEQFGIESAQGMVARNPGLLGIPPVLASEPAEATMALSYLVAVTRPLPKLVVAVSILALLTSGFAPQ